jgi:hypothetical protein
MLMDLKKKKKKKKKKLLTPDHRPNLKCFGGFHYYNVPNAIVLGPLPLLILTITDGHHWHDTINWLESTARSDYTRLVLFQSKADKCGGFHESCISMFPLETSHSTRETLEQLGHWLLPVLTISGLARRRFQS